MLCAIALVLLLDGSGSMSPRDWQTQREQTALAIESPEVINAIERQGAIAVRASAFNVREYHSTPWRLLQNRLDAIGFANEVRQITNMGGLTSIGNVLLEAQESFEQVPCVPDQQIIDLSTDGIDNDASIAAARDAVQIAGTRINVIAVTDAEGAERLRANAVTGDGFLLHASSWDQYPALFRRKIIIESAGL